MTSILRFIARPCLLAGALVTLSSIQTPQRRLKLIPITSDSRIEDIMQSADGQRLITHDRHFAPRLWDTHTLSVIGILGKGGEVVSGVSMSQKGDFVLTIGETKANLWDAKRAKFLGSFEVGKEPLLTCGALSEDGKWIAVGTSSGVLAVCPTDHLDKVRTLPAHSNWIYDVRFSPTGAFVVTSSSDRTAKSFAVATGKPIATYAGHTETVRWTQISRDGKSVLTTGLDNSARLFDAATGKMVFTKPHAIGPKGNLPPTLMSALFVGADGDGVLCAGGDGTMGIYHRATGVLMRELKGHNGAIREIRESRDRLKIATYGTDEELKIWNAVTTKEYPFNRGDDLPTAGEFSSDCKEFWIGGSDGGITRHGLDANSAVGTRRSQVDTMRRLHFSPDRRTMWMEFTGGAGFVPTYRHKSSFTNDLNGEVELHQDRGLAIFSPNGRYSLVERSDQAWEVSDNVRRRYVLRLKKGVISGAFSGDSKRLMTIHENGQVVMWDIESTDGIWALQIDSNKATLNAVAVGLTGERSVIGLEGKTPALVNEKGDVMVDLGSLPVERNAIAFSPDGTKIAINAKNTLAIYSATDGHPIGSSSFKSPGGGVSIYAVPEWTADGKSVTVIDGQNVAVFDGVSAAFRFGFGQATTSLPDWRDQLTADGERILQVINNHVRVWSVAQKKEVTRIDVDGVMTQASFVPGLDVIYTLDDTNGVTFWKREGEGYVRDGSFVWLYGDNWLVVDAQGRFDAPDPAKVDCASYVLEWEGGLEPIGVSQLKQQFFEPGLFSKMLSLDKDARRSVPNLDDLKLYPTVSLELPKGEAKALTVKLTERDGGGIGKVKVFINGKLVDTRDGVGFFEVDLSAKSQYMLPQSELPKDQGNIVSVIAYNEAGDLCSSPTRVDVGIPPGLVAPQVRMFGLCVGVGDYAGTGGDLQSPPSDATALAAALIDSGERLLPGRVHITTLATTKDAKALPTKPAIQQWFASVAKQATSSDIVFVFFSGHGTNKIADLKDYFFLTMESDPTDLNALSAKSGAISGTELQRMLSVITAAKQVVILDTCHSGAAAKNLISVTRSTSGDYQRAYEAIRESSGTWMLAGSAEDQLSYESSSVDHGMLTYALLEAIDKVTSEGMREGSGGEFFLDVDRWLTYAANRVESLKNEVGIAGVQKPELKRSAKGASFDLGVVPATKKGAIGLKAPRPIVIMGSFEIDQEDPLGLEKALVPAMKDSAIIKLWTDVAKHPSVYRVAGTYTLDGTKVAVKVFLQKFDVSEVRKTIDTFSVEGTKETIAEIVHAIRRGIEERIITLEKPKE